MKKYWLQLLPWTRPYLKWLIITFLMAIPLSFIKGYQTYLLKDLFDQGFGTNAPFSDALKLSITLVVLQLVNYPFRFFHFYWIKVISEKVASDIRATLYEKLMKVPLDFYQKHKQGEILSLLQNDVGVISDSIRFFPGIIREPITAVGLLGVALYHDWRLTLVLFLVIPFCIY